VVKTHPMKSVALLMAGTLLLGSGWGSNASAMEPIVLATSTPAVEQPVAQEQKHLQAASSQMRRGVTRDGDLPLEFKKPTGPKAHHLLNLSF
jgi:hypothetical protein